MALIEGIKAFLSPLRDFVINNPTVIKSAATAGIVVGATFAVVEGYEGTKKTERKIGIALHDQGDVLVQITDSTYQHWNKPNQLYGPVFNLSAEHQRDVAVWVGEVGVGRFGESWGCSYTIVACPDSIFWMKPIDGVGAHASGYNFPLVGIMMLRTDNDSLNQLVLYQTRLAIAAVEDSLDHRWDQPLDMLVFHFDIATNGKHDPHEYRPMIKKLGLRWDDRKGVGRLKGLPTKRQAMRRWDETTKQIMN